VTVRAARRGSRGAGGAFLAIVLLSCFGAGAVHAALPPRVDDAALRAAAVASFPELFELLALPNDSINPADIVKNAAWLETAFRKRGFRTELFENRGRPLVFAEYGGNRPGRKTVLFYMHVDGQPVVPSQWAQKDPWTPVVKRRSAGGVWVEVDRAKVMKVDFDPELRVFARSSSDDKGPIVMFLAAFDLMRALELSPAVNVKVLLDSEEEVSSPGIAAAVSAHKALLAADALVVHDGPVHPSGRPTLAFGNRGVVEVTLTVYGPKAPLHSGHYGNYVPNPAQRLARLLAAMKDDDGRVTIADYYARTVITEADRKALAEVPDDEVAIRQRVGIAAADKVGATYQEALQYPSLNVRGLAAAGVGEKAANVVPEKAVAELDLRTTVESDAGYLLPLLRSFVEAQGYHLVDRDPTDEERARFPKLARLKQGLPEKAARQEIDSAVGRWATAALEGAFGGGSESPKPVRIRMMGGTLPTHEIVTPLGMPFVLVPLVNADNNQHAYDENLRLGNYLDGIRTVVGLLLTPYPD